MMRYSCFFLLLLGVFSCSDSREQSGAIPVDEFEQMLQSDPTVQLVDVRTPGEFTAGHLPGAVNYNIHAANFADNLAKLDKSRPVMVYCAVGGRSASAAGQLQQLGFSKVYDLRGGITAWRKAGKNVVQ